jgi:hypothetical protein
VNDNSTSHIFELGKVFCIAFIMALLQVGAEVKCCIMDGKAEEVTLRFKAVT